MQPSPQPPVVAPSLMVKPASIVERLDLHALFPRPQILEVELGSGDGSFIAQYATLHPEKNFLALERLLGRLRKINRKGLRAGLENLRLLRLEAAYCVEYLFPPASVNALHIYFPDPWPKRKHRKNRLVNERFVELSRAVLQPGGIVYLRTDDADYFAQMTTVFGTHGGFQEVPTPLELHQVITDFEREFQRRGVTTLRGAYQLKLLT